MLGLSKNKKESAETALPAASDGDIKEEQFTVMPSQYVAASAPAARSGDRKIYLITGAAVFLLLIGGGAYFLFVYGNRSGGTGAGEAVAPPAGQPPSPAAENVAATTTQPKIITAEARDKENNLLGALSVTIPAPLVEKYGQTIGITVINKDDLALPAGALTLGGLYSAYPLGVAFDEPISLLLSVVKLPPEKSAEDFTPAYLKGAEWQKLSGSQTAAEGWNLSLSQFPNGPITLIQSIAATTTASDLATGTPEQIVAASDADHDGLTDKEEALFGTNAQNKDTDGDTYDDKREIMNNYSPLSGKSEKLSTAAVFKLYTNPQYGYQVFYPAKWLADSLDQTGKQVLFISDTDEFFEVLIEENSANLPIVDWYRSQSPALASVSLDVAVLAGTAAVWSLDHLTLYAGKGGLIYIITYNRGNLTEINWPTAWEYFYKNFKFGNTSAGAGASNNNPATTTAATTGGTTGP